jgi:ketosteroid isomerase-like protein
MAPHGLTTIMAMAAGLVFGTARAAGDEDSRIVGRLDVEFQAAVKANDVSTIERILHPDMILILGNGTVVTRTQLLQEAREQRINYQQQDEVPGTQTVRLYGGDTAVVTALLWVKAVRNGTLLDKRVWFSDVYLRTASGWRYAFGQASLNVPDPTPPAAAPK